MFGGFSWIFHESHPAIGVPGITPQMLRAVRILNSLLAEKGAESSSFSSKNCQFLKAKIYPTLDTLRSLIGALEHDF